MSLPLAELRRRLQGIPARLAERSSRRIPTGIASLDAALQGGLPKRSIVEMTGARSSGRTALALHLLAKATAQGETCVWIDTQSTFDAESAAAVGVDLLRLLWLRPVKEPSQTSARVCDLVLEVGGFGLVVWDWGQERFEDRMFSAARLQRRVETCDTTLLLLAQHSLCTTFAAARLETAALDAHFRGPLFRGIASQIRLSRARGIFEGFSTRASFGT